MRNAFFPRISGNQLSASWARSLVVDASTLAAVSKSGGIRELRFMTVHGKVVLITGAAQGIGRGIALRLARDGAHIALLDLNADKLGIVAQEIGALGQRAIAICADVSNRDDVYGAIAETERSLGGFDVMVNNAGVAQIKPLADVMPEDLDRIFRINVDGVVWGIQAAAKKFIERGQKGKIINAASIAAHEGSPMLPIYSATKFAVRALTQSAAKEYARFGITVNAYCPGIVATDMWDQIDSYISQITGAPTGEATKKYVSSIALGRAQTPDDVAALVAFLASEDASYITGQSIISDGGMVFR